MAVAIHRRRFLSDLSSASVVAVGATAAAPAFWSRAFAEGRSSRDGRTLVVLQLGGGNDALNTVVPYRDDEYYKARPGIAIEKRATLKIDDNIGLHPSLIGFKKLHDEGALSIIQGVGYPNPDRSHFRSMDIWHSANPAATRFTDGWIGRAIDARTPVAGELPALSIGSERLPLAMVGRKAFIPNLRSADEFRFDVGPLDANAGAAMKRTIKLTAEPPRRSAERSPNDELDFIRSTAATAYATAERLETILKNERSAKPYPGGGLGVKLKTIAGLIKGDLRANVYFLSHDGFDTHSLQQKTHAALLQDLGDAVKAFVDDLKRSRILDRVVVLCFSEFGRRVKENASLGTDHGAASHLFAIGSQVNGGALGRHPSLTDLDEGDMKFNLDFRRVYAGSLEGWLGFKSEAALGGEFEPFDFVKKS